MRRHLALLVFAFGVAFGSWPVRAEDASPAIQAQSVITSQIEAFGRDDALTAHSFASPGIKRIFPDPNAFLAMVKQSYAPLVHPRSTHFDTPDTETVQKMTIVDSNGVVWTALYTLEQVDGQWRISGCSLLKAPDVGA